VSAALTLDDFEALARERLSPMAYEYVASGAADEVTLRATRSSFERILLRPRVLRDVSRIDTTTTLLGEELAFPILLAPVAYQRLLHPEGEIEAARGAVRSEAIFVMSTAATSSIEDVAATGAHIWMQIYQQGERAVTRDLVQRAEAAGARALCLTVDTPAVGTRTRQQRVGFALPADLPTPHLDAAARQRLGKITALRVPITWNDVDWLRAQTKLPLLLKGILDADDASLAIEHGAAGVIVSNHGARNLDTVPATIDALPAIADAVAGRCPLLLDGGIRRGTDVIKAIARGASSVLIGRPYAYALAVEGAAGVTRAVAILREELETAMALLGVDAVSKIDRSVLFEAG
jgi:4-hydroxymandelate oxidase